MSVSAAGANLLTISLALNLVPQTYRKCQAISLEGKPHALGPVKKTKWIANELDSTVPQTEKQSLFSGWGSAKLGMLLSALGHQSRACWAINILMFWKIPGSLVCECSGTGRATQLQHSPPSQPLSSSFLLSESNLGSIEHLEADFHVKIFISFLFPVFSSDSWGLEPSHVHLGYDTECDKVPK